MGFQIKLNARTLTILTLVMFTPLILINVYSINHSEQELIENTHDHLKSIANERITRLVNNNEANLETLSLLTSRTQLRLSLVEYLANTSDFEQQRMNLILEDAQLSVDRLLELSIYTLSGMVVSSTIPSRIGTSVNQSSFFAGSTINSQIGNLFFNNNQVLSQYLTEPLYHDGNLIGVLLAVINLVELREILEDYVGLGSTGEIILANKTKSGAALILNPLRFYPEGALSMTIPDDDINNPITLATDGVKQFYPEVTDYRGNKVIAISDYIEQTGWGVVVKIDHDEALSQVVFQDRLLYISLIISLLIFSGSYLFISKYLSSPVENLTEFANKLADGDLDKRVKVSSINEIEVLADTLNTMARTLNETESNLSQTISKLEASQAMLVHSQKMDAIGRLSGGIAHDFNNLLTIMMGYIELLKLDIIDTDRLETLDKIEQASLRARDITSQLLQISRKSVMNEEIIAVTIVINEIGSIFERLLKENILLSVTHHQKNTHIKMERSKFEQILLNLAINASEAMENGGRLDIVTDLVSSFRISSDTIEGNYVKIQISDEGQGMSPKTLEKIYDPFFTTKSHGTGLGLAVAYGIVKQCEGYITVDSTLGVGTIFNIYLPLVYEESKVVEDHFHQKHVDLSDIYVLIVEDDEEIKKIIKRILGTYNIESIAAKSGNDAIQIVENSEIDVLITDIVMPDYDGRVLAEILERKDPDLKTLYISGYSQSTFNLGPNEAYLQKPFSASELLNKLQDLIDDN